MAALSLRPIRPRTISSRVLAGFVLTALLPALLISVGTTVVGYYEGQRQTIERLESVAALKTLGLERWAASLQDELLVAISDDGARERAYVVLDLAQRHTYYSWYNEAVRGRLALLALQSQHFAEFCLLNLQGRVVLCTAPERAESQCAAEPFFRSGLSAPYVAVSVGEPATGRALCDLAASWAAEGGGVASRPVLGQGNAILGVVVGRTPPGVIDALLADRTGLGSTGRAYLAGDGSPAGPPRGWPEGSGDTASVVRVSRPIAALGATLVIEQAFTEAFGAVLRSLLVSGGITLAGAALAVAAAFLLSRSITRPLVSLVDTATRIATGDLERTAVVHRDDEIGALARAFNSMTGQLRDLISSLERRVQDRTRALERRALQLETSAAVSRQVTAILAIDDLLAQVVQLIRDAFGFTHARVYLVEGEILTLRAATSGAAAVASTPLQLTSLNSEAARTGQPVLVNDVQRDPRFLAEAELPGTRAELAIPLRAGAAVIGTLDVLSDRPGAFGAEDLLVLQSLGDQIAVAIENARLYQRSRELAVVEERNRLARDLHDSVTQSLYSLSLMVAGWRKRLRAGESVPVEEHYERAAEIAQQALKEMRLLVYQLRPAALERDGLVGALHERLGAVERRAGVRARLVAGDLLDLPAPIEVELYYIAQEALNNALKHSGAAEVVVSLEQHEGAVTMQVRDDGRGLGEPGGGVGGMGLANMRQRAEALGGSLTVGPGPGGGFLVRACIPMAGRAARDGGLAA